MEILLTRKEDPRNSMYRGYVSIVAIDSAGVLISTMTDRKADSALPYQAELRSDLLTDDSLRARL